MTPLTEKQKIEKILQRLPAETSIAEAMERLYLLYKVEKGLQQADTGQTVSHKEARERLRKWLD